MSHATKIIICTEKGNLEKYSILLCRSIRQFGGAMADVEILSFAPRKGNFPTQKTISALTALGVKHQNINLNTKHKNYYLANKPFVCAYVEEKYPQTNLLFIDSDQVVFNAFDVSLEQDNQLFLRPVDLKGIGYSDESEINYSYWKQLFELFSISPKAAKIRTSLGEDIYPYYNSGLILVNSRLGLFKKWLENLDSAITQSIFPADKFFLEQSMLTITAMQLNLQINKLPRGYNYPFSLHDKITSDLRIDNLEEIVTAHYHDLLVNRPYPDYFETFLTTTEKGRWLNEQIKDLDIKPDSTIQKIIKRVRKKLDKKFF